jgi:Fic family protein
MSAGDPRVDPQLRRQARIGAVHASTVIEGNRLTPQQAEAVVDGNRVIAPPTDILEMRGAWAAYEALPTYAPASIADFLRAHALLMNDLVAEPGVFRTVDVEIVNADDEVLHTGSRFAKVPRLMGELLEWASGTDDHPLIVSSAVHFMIELIHPFRDGNGRMGRLWQTLLLSRWQPVMAWIPVETVVLEHQAGYYQALQASHEPDIDSAPFIDFMLGVIEECLDEVNQMSR